MSGKEINELLRLTGWSQVQLAREMEVSEAAISRWLSSDRAPLGPARVLMREWLEAARTGKFRELQESA